MTDEGRVIKRLGPSTVSVVPPLRLSGALTCRPKSTRSASAGNLIRSLIDLLVRSNISVRLGSYFRRIEAANDMRLFVWVRSFDGPTFLSRAPLLANANYAESRHADRFGFRPDLRNPKFKTATSYTLALPTEASQGQWLAFRFTLIHLFEYMIRIRESFSVSCLLIG